MTHDLACRALKKHGYHVLKAIDGPQALGLWERHSTQVDLVLTDMVMPNGMSGSELGKTLQSRNPLLKVVWTSGYSPEIIGEDSLLEQAANFLPKPYNLHALVKAVQDSLAARPDATLIVLQSAAPVHIG